MKTTTRIDVTSTYRALATMITAANGGAMPDTFEILVGHIGAAHVGGQAIHIYDPTDGKSRLLVTIEDDGRLKAVVGVATSWTTLLHDGFRFALTPSGLLILLGRHAGRPMFFSFEGGSLFCDTGSPLLSASADAEAMSGFDEAFAALVAETL